MIGTLKVVVILFVRMKKGNQNSHTTQIYYCHSTNKFTQTPSLETSTQQTRILFIQQQKRDKRMRREEVNNGKMKDNLFYWIIYF